MTLIGLIVNLSSFRETEHLDFDIELLFLLTERLSL